MARTPPLLVGPRVQLRLARAEDVAAVVDYFVRNRAHLAATSPMRPEEFYAAPMTAERIAADQAAFQDDKSCKLFIFRRGDDSRVIGTVSFTEVVRGPLQQCFLGYSIDAAECGQGLASEAVRLAIDYGFGELNLHRVSADYLPTNAASGRVLRKLGFTVEGYARDMLLLDGKWQDHILTSLTNPTWRIPSD